MHRIRILVIFPFLIISIFPFVLFEDFFYLNNFSIGVVKGIYQDTNINNYWILDNKLVSHYEWLGVMGKAQEINESSEKSDYINFIQVSKLYANMIRVLFPNDFGLASEANNNYPNTKEYLYWVLDGVNTDVALSKKTINEILEIDPQDAVAWRRLGTLLWRSGEKEKGLQAYLNACEINDRASNGCYYVGTSYRAKGDVEKAIYYFRISFWSSSWDIADQLEQELSTKNP